MNPRPATGGLDAVAALVRERTGLVFGEARRRSFEAAAARAMGRAGIADPAAYAVRLSADPRLLEDLAGEITVGETYFFRDPNQLELIRRRILPDLAARRPAGHRLRIWSAGCASGEEPYTLAIMARELGLEPPPHIVATDLSRPALSRAARARYGRWSLRGVPDAVIRANFARAGDQFLLDPALREAVDLAHLNLAEAVYPSVATGIWGMDLILCRNVLIYFDRDTAQRVVQRLFDSLADGGWLVLGASDPLVTPVARAETVATDAGLVYRRRDVNLPALHPEPPPPARDPVGVSPPAPSSTQPDAEFLRAVPARVRPAPGSPRDQVAVARQLYAARDYAAAAAVAERLVEGGAADPGAWTVLVRSLANRGELEAAERRCAAAVDRHRDSAELLYLHAVLLCEAGRHADAVRAARGAVYLDRTMAVAHMALGSALARTGERVAAARAFRNAERLLSAWPAASPVPASDGELAGRLAEMVKTQIALLYGTTS